MSICNIAHCEASHRHRSRGKSLVYPSSSQSRCGPGAVVWKRNIHFFRNIPIVQRSFSGPESVCVFVTVRQYPLSVKRVNSSTPAMAAQYAPMPFKRRGLPSGMCSRFSTCSRFERIERFCLPVVGVRRECRQAEAFVFAEKQIIILCFDNNRSGVKASSQLNYPRMD